MISNCQDLEYPMSGLHPHSSGVPTPKLDIELCAISITMAKIVPSFAVTETMLMVIIDAIQKELKNV